MGVGQDVLFECICNEPEGDIIRKVTPFPFTPENLAKLWLKAKEFPTLMGKEIPTFDHMLSIFVATNDQGQHNSKGLCVQIDDLIGLFWLTDIEWPNQCSIHYTFFDRRHRGRLDLCKMAVKYIFNKYQFHRVYTQVPLYAKSILKFVEDIGFKKDGRMRSNVFFRHSWYDSNMYSILDTEV